MTKNKKIQLLTNEVKALQEKLDLFTNLETKKTEHPDTQNSYNEKAVQLIKELELEKMQYRELRKELEEVKKKYELMYKNRFNDIKSVFFKYMKRKN